MERGARTSGASPPRLTAPRTPSGGCHVHAVEDRTEWLLRVFVCVCVCVCVVVCVQLCVCVCVCHMGDSGEGGGEDKQV